MDVELPSVEGWIEEIAKIKIAGKVVTSEIRYKEDSESYTFSCNCAYHWGHAKVVLSMAKEAPRICEARALKKHFQAQGIQTVEWERRGGIGPRTVKLKIGD